MHIVHIIFWARFFFLQLVEKDEQFFKGGLDLIQPVHVLHLLITAEPIAMNNQIYNTGIYKYNTDQKLALKVCLQGTPQCAV